MSGNTKYFPLLFIFPALLLLVTAQPISMVDASKSEPTNIPQLGEEGAIQQQQQGTTGQPQCITAPCPGDDGTDDDGEDTPTQDQNQASNLPFPSGSNTARSEQTGGISAGDIIQRSNSAVTEQYCKTIAGIGDRRCQQEAPEGALQECSAIAGLGKANCVQSENPDGTGTCLSANGKPFICETSTGKSISGSGQAGQ